MSTSSTDAPPTASLASVVATDRAALAPVGGVAAGWEVVYKIASRRDDFSAAFGLSSKAYGRRNSADSCARNTPACLDLDRAIRST